MKKPNQLFVVSISLILVGVLTGAFGAHSLENRVDEELIQAWITGSQYLIYHGLAFLIFAFGLKERVSIFSLPLTIMLIGLVCFSGSLFGLGLNALAEGSASKVLGPITPIGGTLIIISWALVLMRGIKKGDLFRSPSIK